MKHFILACTIIFMITSCSHENMFENNFTGSTLRVNYYSIGTKDYEKAELISFQETSDWYGPHKNLIDTADLGEYRIIMKDSASGNTIYLNGFCTLFGEWRTSEEAKTKTEQYYNYNNVPMPKNPAIITIECRDRNTMKFYAVGTFNVNPKDVKKCDLPANKVSDVLISGNITNKVDLVFLADGYQSKDESKFMSDVQRFTEALFKCPPFDKYKNDFNVRAVMLNSDSTGVDHPGIGIDRSTALNSNYYTFGTDRYLTTRDMESVANATWDVPSDAIFILVNEPVYGGGGIYNFYAIGSTDDKRTLSVFTHEFGHSLGALADEYFYSSTPYDSFYSLECEPWEANITTLKNFDRKWKDLLPEGAAIPTIVTNHDSIPEIGVFEGGGYLIKGIYRPADHCMMRDYAPFCKACTRSIIRNISFICDK